MLPQELRPWRSLPPSSALPPVGSLETEMLQVTLCNRPRPWPDALRRQVRLARARRRPERSPVKWDHDPRRLVAQASYSGRVRAVAAAPAGRLCAANRRIRRRDCRCGSREGTAGYRAAVQQRAVFAGAGALPADGGRAAGGLAMAQRSGERWRSVDGLGQRCRGGSGLPWSRVRPGSDAAGRARSTGARHDLPRAERARSEHCCPVTVRQPRVPSDDPADAQATLSTATAATGIGLRFPLWSCGAVTLASRAWLVGWDHLRERPTASPDSGSGAAGSMRT
jgi:hypothetical protein